MHRHNQEADRRETVLIELVRRADSQAQVRSSGAKVSSNPDANGGYCWYFPRAVIRSRVPAAEMERRMENDLRGDFRSASGRSLLRVVVRSAGPDSLVVRGEDLGEGGSLDPRCA
jgi:hypothetical protein